MATNRRVVAFAALFLAIVVPHASADPVLITGGFMATLERTGRGTASITGTRGFAVLAPVNSGEGRVDALDACFPCAPGVPLSVGANLSGSVFELGSFTLDGVRYNDIAQTDSSARLFFELFGGGTVPPIQDQPVLFTTPFTLTGLIILPFPSPGNPPVVGRGIATVTLMPQLVDPETKVWLSQSVRYDFSDASAVPEPATLVLVGSGIVGCLLRRRQRASC